VQVRTRPRSATAEVAINVAVAARVAGDVVAFYGSGIVRVNHAVSQLAGGRTALRGGGAIYRVGPSYTVVWPDGMQLRVDLSREPIAVHIYAPDSRRGHLVGLLGNFDGASAGDLVTRDGIPVPTPASFEMFYGVFAESWRVAQVNSLFDYAAGETTEPFTDRSSPHHVASAKGLADPDRNLATAVCRAAHVAAEWFDDCLLDVGFTGDASFASDLATAPPASSS